MIVTALETTVWVAEQDGAGEHRCGALGGAVLEAALHHGSDTNPGVLFLEWTVVRT
jgi:hypothetical protein